VNGAALGTGVVYGGLIAAAEFGPPLIAQSVGRWYAFAGSGSGVVVLGTFPEYLQKAQSIGANALNMPDKLFTFLEIWERDGRQTKHS
jgi:hypothetical protein